jgi:replicative DNA helicase
MNIDHQTLGLVGGEMTIIAGKTSMGKTSLAMNIANNVAKQGHTVLFVTLEMTHAELTSRFMFLNGGETDEYYKVSAHIFYQKNDELNWKDIDGLIENAKKQIGAELVVIDHLHYFSREIEHVTQDIGRIAKEVKKNAIRHEVPIILISHVRKVEKGKDATSEDLKDSAAIAQDADIVQMVGRAKDNGNMLVKIEKNRNRGKPTDRGERKVGEDYRDDPDVSELEFQSTKLKEISVEVPANIFNH